MTKVSGSDGALEIEPKLIHKDRVLLTDDSVIALNIMKKSLENKGFEVCAVGSGAECIDLFTNSYFNLVVLDFMMPGMDGLETLRALRKYKSPEELPVIMITAKQSKDLIKEAISCGINDFILKPLHPAEFVSRINRILIKVSDSDIVKILLSLNIADPSVFERETREHLASQNLSAYPFKLGGVKCCAVLRTGRNPHVVAELSSEKVAEELVLIAKGGYLWNTIWPRKNKAQFSVTKTIFNDGENLNEILKEGK